MNDEVKLKLTQLLEEFPSATITVLVHKDTVNGDEFNYWSGELAEVYFTKKAIINDQVFLIEGLDNAAHELYNVETDDDKEAPEFDKWLLSNYARLVEMFEDTIVLFIEPYPIDDE